MISILRYLYSKLFACSQTTVYYLDAIHTCLEEKREYIIVELKEF